MENEATKEMYAFTWRASVLSYWAALVLVFLCLIFMLGSPIPEVLGYCMVSVGAFGIFSILQPVWQGITCEFYSIWLDAMDVKEVDEWPWWIAAGGWFFFALKVVSIISAIVFLCVYILEFVNVN